MRTFLLAYAATVAASAGLAAWRARDIAEVMSR